MRMEREREREMVGEGVRPSVEGREEMGRGRGGEERRYR